MTAALIPFQQESPEIYIPENDAALEMIRVVACPNPFSAERKIFYFPLGMTIKEMVRDIVDKPILAKHARVFIGDLYIPDICWSVVRPKSNFPVFIRVVPTGGGGGGKNPLRIFLQIAVIAISFYIPTLLPKALIDTALISGLTVGNAITAFVGLVGNLIINAIIPPPTPKVPSIGSSSRDEQARFITGTRNQSNPFGPVPRIFGKIRVFPKLGARPYSEIVGSDQYFRMLFVWGFGPISISNLRIEQTAIDEFEEVETETVQGYPGDPALTLFANDVHEESLQILLEKKNGWTVRTTQQDIDEISVDIAFPQGLVRFDSQGKKKKQQVEVDVEYSPTGQNNWTFVKRFSFNEKKQKVIRKGKRWTVARGQYDVRLKRITDNSDSDKIFDQVQWAALRSIKCEDPINFPGLAKTAVRIKATDQLNGILERFNAVAESIVKDWDSGTQTWIERETSNPASLLREALQGGANARPLLDSQIDLAALQDWHGKCVAAGREFNMNVDFKSSVREVAAMVASAGRGSPGVKDNKWSVVLDEPQTIPIQHFTPRNSWDFKGEKNFLDVPHGWRIRFNNRDKDWETDERIVYDDGFDENNATEFETLELSGVTDPEQVWKDGRYHIAVGRLRPEVYSFFVDVENLVCTRGDLIRLTHDVPLWGGAAGRVKALNVDGSNTTGVILDELVFMEAGKTYSLRFRKTSDGSTLLQAVDTAVGETNTLTFSTPIATATGPQVEDLAMFGETGKETVELLIKSIEPGPDLSARLTCIDASPEVHNADAGPIPPFDSKITLPPDIQKPLVTNIRSDESVLLVTPGGEFIARMVLTISEQLERPADITGIETHFRLEGSAAEWDKVATPPNAAEVSLQDVETGETYEIRMRYLKTGEAGPWTGLFTHTVIGTDTPPNDVVGLFLEGDFLRWTYPTEPIDFAGFKLRYREGNNRNWEGGTAMHDGLITETEFFIGGIPRGTRTFMIASVDTSGNRSGNIAVLVRDIGTEVIENLVDTIDLDAQGFPGQITGGSVVAGQLKANGSGDPFWSSNLSDPFWIDGNDPFWTSIYDELEYIATVVPEETVLDTVLKVDLTVQGSWWRLDYQPETQEPIWTIDSDVLWTNDADPFWDAVPNYQPWPGRIENLVDKPYNFRLTVAGGSTQGIVSNFDIKFDTPDIFEYFNDLAIASGGTRLPITQSYRTIKNVNLTLQDDGGSAITIKTKDKNAALGPLVQAFDGTGTGTAATIDATVQGARGA